MSKKLVTEWAIVTKWFDDQCHGVLLNRLWCERAGYANGSKPDLSKSVRGPKQGVGRLFQSAQIQHSHLSGSIVLGSASYA